MPQFSVTTPATDLTLLDAEELRVAAGLARDDDSQDETLAEHEAEVAAEIMSDCAIASDGVHPPTLRSEECTDVFDVGCGEGVLFLSRRHVSDVATITVNETALEETDWRLDRETGRLLRYVSGAKSSWSTSPVAVAYTAGFAVVPSELKAEAKARIKIKVSESSRDPLARTISTEIPDIETRTIGYQVGGLSRLTGEGLSSESERRLRRFMMQSMVG